MRTVCDVCEGAAALVFCAADEAALCPSCDDKVHRCNKLASRHVRVGLATPSAVPRCDICENAPAFFYCEVDGSSLCLQCDMIVHVGGKRTHPRYLLLRQRIEFPGNKAGETGENKREKSVSTKTMEEDDEKKRVISSVPKLLDGNSERNDRRDKVLIDLNIHASNNQD